MDSDEATSSSWRDRGVRDRWAGGGDDARPGGFGGADPGRRPGRPEVGRARDQCQDQVLDREAADEGGEPGQAGRRGHPAGRDRPARCSPLDDFNGILYRKNYTLRAVGAHIEVWVANDTVVPGRRLPRRRSPTPRTVTDAQVAGPGRPVRQQHVPEGVGRPSASPPDRDGSRPDVGNGGDYTGDGDKIVTLVDNVRDDNYYHVPGGADLHRRLLLRRSSTSCSTATS